MIVDIFARGSLNKLEIKRKTTFKCVETSFKKVRSLGKPSLKSQKVSEINQALMMVIVPLQELDQLVDIHR